VESVLKFSIGAGSILGLHKIAKVAECVDHRFDRIHILEPLRLFLKFLSNYGIKLNAKRIIYPTSLKNRIFGFAKASRLNDHKRVHIFNIDPFMIVQSRELSLKPKTDFSITLGINASCPFQKLCKQIPLCKDPLQMKISTFSTLAVAGPILEELLCRGLIQDLLLKRGARVILKNILPGKESWVDTTIAKIFRITTTAGLFSAMHLLNKGAVSNEYLHTQLIAAFVGGIVFGALKESKAGMPGAIGGHAANNTLVILPLLQMC
jgi:hypothetical protein